MYPIQHFLLGLVFIFIVYLVFPSVGILGLFIIFLSSVLIDVDHYIYYSAREKNLNIKKSYSWFLKRNKKFKSLPLKQRKKVSLGIYFLHSIEIMTPIFLIGLFSNTFYFIFIGFLFHIFADLIYEVIVEKRDICKIFLFYSISREMKYPL